MWKSTERRTMARTKKGFELSISMLVLIILGLAMFTMSLIFLGKLNEKIVDITVIIDQQTKNRLQTELDDGKRLIERMYEQDDDAYISLLGIFNTENKKFFRINIECSGILVDDKIEPCSDFDSKRIVYWNNVTIERDQKYISNIVIDTNELEKEGTYIFNIYVCNGETMPVICKKNSTESYYPIMKMHVNVE